MSLRHARDRGCCRLATHGPRDTHILDVGWRSSSTVGQNDVVLCLLPSTFGKERRIFTRANGGVIHTSPTDGRRHPFHKDDRCLSHIDAVSTRWQKHTACTLGVPNSQIDPNRVPCVRARKRGRTWRLESAGDPVSAPFNRFVEQPDVNDLRHIYCTEKIRRPDVVRVEGVPAITAGLRSVWRGGSKAFVGLSLRPVVPGFVADIDALVARAGALPITTRIVILHVDHIRRACRQ